MATLERQEKARIQVSISRKLLDMLDSYCNAIGVSRSAYIQTTLGQSLYSINQLQSSLPVAVAALAQQDSPEPTAEDVGRALWGDDFGRRPEGL